MKKIISQVFSTLLILTTLTIPSPVFAHAFGQNYTLPLPVWLYLYGGGGALVVSFLIIGWFINKPGDKLNFAKKDLSSSFVTRFLMSESTQKILKGLSLLLLFLTILAGLLGSPFPSENLAPLMFWIFLMLGITYLSAIFGNFWSIINPFKIMTDFVISFLESDKPTINYPKKLGFLPAAFFYFLIIWLELLSSGMGANPRFLSMLLIVYTILTILCSILFGKEAWFKYGEFFSVFFGLISNASIFESQSGQKIYLRPPFIGLVKKEAKSFSLLIFILFILSSTAFDGFRSTTTWLRLYFGNFSSLTSFFGDSAYEIVQTILLFLSPLFFLFFYLLALGLMKLILCLNLSIKDLSLKFALTLVPIALAYNIAHYYTLLFVQGQSIINLISDPLNFGWNLFGTLDYPINVGILGASFVWNSQVATIIIGHIAAVYLAHLVALEIFPSHKKAIISQLPMLALMVIYTITGLWILSQPLTPAG